MEPIKPKQYLDDEHVADFRSATEHRATWMYLLVDEARKRGLDPEFARDAIYRCGCFHRSQKPETDSLKDYCESVFHQIGRKVFEQEVDITEEQATVVFHYCPPGGCLAEADRRPGVHQAPVRHGDGRRPRHVQRSQPGIPSRPDHRGRLRQLHRPRHTEEVNPPRIPVRFRHRQL